MYNPFSPNYSPYFFQQAQMPYSQTQATNQIPLQNGGSFYFVNSLKDVEDWVVGAGQTVFFFERNNPVFYIKSVAQNGLSQPIEIYDYSQRSSERASEALGGASEVNLDNYITRDEFSKFEARINALLNSEVVIDE